jgi:hypothetical protein
VSLVIPFTVSNARFAAKTLVWFLAGKVFCVRGVVDNGREFDAKTWWIIHQTFVERIDSSEG